MKWFERLGLGLLVLIALVVGIGFALPSDFTVVRSIKIERSASEIFPLVGDLKQWRRWGVWYERDPNMETTYSGAPFQIGHKVAWKSETQGDGEMSIIEIAPSQSMTYSLFFPDFDMASTGKLTLTEEGAATLVEWSDTGDVGNDILGRYFLLFIDDMIGPDFEAGLAKLKKVAESS